MSSLNLTIVDDYGEAVSKNATKSWWGKPYMTPVGNQGHPAYCAPFAVCDSLSAKLTIQIENDGLPLPKSAIALSKQELYDCVDRTDLRVSFRKCFNYARDHGIFYEEKYNFSDNYKDDCRSNSVEGRKCKIVDWHRVPECDVLKTLDQHPIVASIRDASLLNFCAPYEGVYTAKHFSGDTRKGRHAFLIIGYGDEDGVPYFIVKNCWGLHWGTKGYAKIDRSVFEGFVAPGFTTWDDL